MRFVLGQKIINSLRGKAPWKTVMVHCLGCIYNLKFLNKKKTFDEIFSLGYNCEVAQRISNIFPKFNHYLYTYTYELNRELFIETLLHPENTWDDDFTLENDMVKGKKSQMKFHLRNKDKIFDSKGELIKENYEIAIEELKSRIKYLGEKTKNFFESGKSALFIMKIKYLNSDDDKKFIQNVFYTLEKVFKGHFVLLCVVEKTEYNENLFKELKQVENNKLFIRSIKSFAPDDKTNCEGDIKGWLSLICKFYTSCAN